MTSTEIIQNLLAGGLLGLLGQGIRMAIGLKKLSDFNAGNTGTNEKADSTRLLISLFIGFVAGALFILTKGETPQFTNEFIFAVMAAGYSGADFIEGLFNNYLSKLNPPTPAPTPTPVPAADPAVPPVMAVTSPVTTPADTAVTGAGSSEPTDLEVPDEINPNANIQG